MNHEIFERARAKGKPILLDFTAEWCSTCMTMDEIVEKRIARKYEGKITLVKLDVNEHIELAKKLNIFSVPTFIFLKPSGEEIWRKVGMVDGEEIIEDIEKVVK